MNNAESFVPSVKVEPLAHANVSIPWATDRVSESVLTPAAASVKLTALLLPVEETSDPFSLIDPVAGAALARRLAALTVRAMPLASKGHRSGRGPKLRVSRAGEPVVGADVSLLKAAFRLAIVPVAVGEAEPLVPVVRLNPIVEPRVSLPFEADSESESELLPAAASITEIALLLAVAKTSEVFPVPGAVPDAVIAGAARALTVGDALDELDSASTG